MICASYNKLWIPGNLGSPNWEKALNWLREDAWKDLPLGRTEIDASRVFVNRSSYISVNRKNGKWESHRLYADIQMVIKGKELLFVCRQDGLNITVPYSRDNDCEILEGNSEHAHGIVLDGIVAAVLFPWDIHMPAIAIEENPAQVEKIVLKVAL